MADDHRNRVPAAGLLRAVPALCAGRAGGSGHSANDLVHRDRHPGLQFIATEIVIAHRPPGAAPPAVVRTARLRPDHPRPRSLSDRRRLHANVRIVPSNRTRPHRRHRRVVWWRSRQRERRCQGDPGEIGANGLPSDYPPYPVVRRCLQLRGQEELANDIRLRRIGCVGPFEAVQAEGAGESQVIYLRIGRPRKRSTATRPVFVRDRLHHSRRCAGDYRRRRELRAQRDMAAIDLQQCDRHRLCSGPDRPAGEPCLRGAGRRRRHRRVRPRNRRRGRGPRSCERGPRKRESTRTWCCQEIVAICWSISGHQSARRRTAG